LNRQKDTPLDGLEELIVALHDISAVLERPALARLARIAQAAEQVTGPPPLGSTRKRPQPPRRTHPPSVSTCGTITDLNDTELIDMSVGYEAPQSRVMST
jgi:hypothetical protein